MFDQLKNIVTNQAVGSLASYVTFISFLAVLYNSWRLSKIARFVNAEHEKLVDTIKPFDLYFKIQEAANLATSSDQKIVEGLKASAECLRFYFREFHGLVVKRDNIFLDVGHAYLKRNQTERALEYYTKAYALIDGERDTRERIECLHGMLNCYARLGSPADCTAICEELEMLRSDSEPFSIGSQVRGFTAMWFIRLRGVLTPTIFRRPRQYPLPHNFDTTHGDLKNLSKKIEPTTTSRRKRPAKRGDEAPRGKR